MFNRKGKVRGGRLSPSSGRMDWRVSSPHLYCSTEATSQGASRAALTDTLLCSTASSGSEEDGVPQAPIQAHTEPRASLSLPSGQVQVAHSQPLSESMLASGLDLPTSAPAAALFWEWFTTAPAGSWGRALMLSRFVNSYPKYMTTTAPS